MQQQSKAAAQCVKIQTAHIEDPIVHRLAKLPTCTVADALAQKKIKGHLVGLLLQTPLFIDGAEVPTSSEAKRVAICGRAYTVQMAPSDGAPVPAYTKGHHVDTAKPGSIVVIAAPEGTTGVWGGLMSARAKTLHCKAAVLDGLCRDVDESRELSFPIFSKGLAVHGNRGVYKVSNIEVPIIVAGRLIRPWDILHGDVNGVVVIPQEKAEEIALLAEKIDAEDGQVKSAVLEQGMTVQEAFQRYRSKL